MVGERPRPFGEALGFDPMTSTLIFGEHDAVLVDAQTTVAEAEALADWVALHRRNLRFIYITHGHADHILGFDDIRPYNIRQNMAMPVYGNVEAFEVLRSLDRLVALGGRICTGWWRLRWR